MHNPIVLRLFPQCILNLKKKKRKESEGTTLLPILQKMDSDGDVSETKHTVA